ncbi:ubiquitin carboxyl-terminal hydrolase 19 [Aplysia californica]|uniref:ubiquitinyl hydrolase 1 n=1 Tax=Aplysia californica TaxID=6500 RepID=A0ABM1AAF7_APLCA|nr:ubiquitin carboxyl-terminal hydrolase 19 [Aplysia californica]
MAELGLESNGSSQSGSSLGLEEDRSLPHSLASGSGGFQNKETLQEWDPGYTSSCTSAKQYRKMEGKDEPVSLTYTWKQTQSDVTVTVKLKGLRGEHNGAFDITFTCNEVHIGISNDISHSIQFYGAIEKEKSRVQLTKENIILIVIKQLPSLWPKLESEVQPEVSDAGGSKMGVVPGDDVSDVGTSARLDNCNKTIEDMQVADSDSREEDVDKGTEITDKEEEPVFHLDHLKHGFFERDMVLSLQVYVKSLDKDAMKIVFSKQGFVLKFHTADAKFLQLHEGTSAETTFSWAVTTRQEIVPEECKYKVKASGMEVTLRKTSAVRWASLEAPLRKEPTEPPRNNDSWVPLTRSTGPPTPDSPSEPPASSTSSAGVAAGSQAENGPSRSVMFDDMEDIDLKSNRGKYKGSSSSINSQRMEPDADSISSVFGSNLKTRPTGVSQDWNKPTAKVHPLNKQGAESAIVISPGYAGLVNLGNTCFMNCVLQVMVNTREFRDYFLDDRFQHEINEDNPLGMKGQLAATFGLLLKRLWSCLKYCWEPRKLKDLISKKNPQFFGYAQHDAHEFLAFLLDGLHEDLNRIRKKPYIETTDSNGRPDEVVAAEAWAQYKSRNDSVVVDLFQGQYKSKLVCPVCGKVSITFDPFLYLSVPLPKKKKVIPVTFMWKESYKKPVRYQIVVSQDSTVEKLIEELAQKTNVRKRDIRVFEAYRGKILKFFLSGSSLSNVEAKDIIIASEVLSEELAGEEVLEIPVMQRTLLPSDYPIRCAFCHKPCMDGSPLKRCTKCFKVGYCDHTCQRKHWNQHKSQCSMCLEPIGCPFILSLPASRATYGHLVKHMEGFARFSVDVFQPPVKTPEVPIPSATSLTPKPGVGGGPVPASNLSSSLSQSCSSLNSLDSLSSASSTCTLTGDQSDSQTQAETGEEVVEAVASSSLSDSDQFVTASVSSSSMAAVASPSGAESVPGTSDANDNMRCASVDSGFESVPSRSEKPAVPTSQVMGVQATDQERDKATPTFFIKPVSMEGVGIKGAERLEDKGDKPLELTNRRILSMDWRNNEKLSSYVLVQSKELEGEEAENLNNVTASTSNKPTLYQCLELFTEPEVLNPEEAWYCPSCKKHVEASKQMSIWRLPHTLIIQLKRFSFQNFLMRSKIKKHVEFPTRGLDLSEYCVGQAPGESPPVYDLYGVANHHGLLIGGHYTSYVRCHSDNALANSEVGWRLCDDSRVSPIASEKSVVTADAYLLFYRRRGCPGIIGGPTPSSSSAAAAAAAESSYHNTSSSSSSSTPLQPCDVDLILPLSEPSHVIRQPTPGNSRATVVKNDLQRNVNDDVTIESRRRQEERSSSTSELGCADNSGNNKLNSERERRSGVGGGGGDADVVGTGKAGSVSLSSSSSGNNKLSHAPSLSSSSSLSSSGSEDKQLSPLERGEVEPMEKQDREKEVYNCDNNEDDHVLSKNRFPSSSLSSTAPDSSFQGSSGFGSSQFGDKLLDEEDDNYRYDDPEDYDEDLGGGNLVIDTSPDLGYTDMEAVD